MRQIKFRAWNNDKKEWIDQNSFFVMGDGELGSYGSQDDTGDFMDDIVTSQFTGLLDKNGTPIFEGDIVEGNISHSSGREVVKYEGGGFSPFAIPGWEITPKSENVEVIGNIYENETLLKG
jgi:uncharacterized phage protein (TIGR01671 family)